MKKNKAQRAAERNEQNMHEVNNIGVSLCRLFLNRCLLVCLYGCCRCRLLLVLFGCFKTLFFSLFFIVFLLYDFENGKIKKCLCRNARVSMCVRARLFVCVCMRG